jgi:hypothetical protein
MAYIRALGHNVPLMMQIAEGGHAQVYANLLHARFSFHPTSIYIEEEVLSESGNIDRTILQVSFRDDEGQLWLLPPGRYKAFGLNATLMAASTDLVSQPSDMSSVQPPLLHSVKLEMPDNLVNLSSDSSEGALPNVPPPTPAAHIPVSNSKCSEYSTSVFTPVGSSSHSNLSWPPFHPNTCEYPSVMQCLRRLASFPGSKNKLATLDYDKIPYHKVQYLPLRMMATLFFSCRQVLSLLLPLRTLWTVWISGLMVTHGAAPSPPIFTIAKASLLGSPCVLASWFVTTRVVTSLLDRPSAMRLSGQAEPTLHSN